MKTIYLYVIELEEENTISTYEIETPRNIKGEKVLSQATTQATKKEIEDLENGNIDIEQWIQDIERKGK